MKKRLVLVFAMFACVIAVGLSACDDRHAITLDAEDYAVQSCPTHAKTGEVVAVETCDVCDADLYVSVDGDQGFGTFTSACRYEFTMPDHDVTVKVWIISNGLA